MYIIWICGACVCVCVLLCSATVLGRHVYLSSAILPVSHQILHGEILKYSSHGASRHLDFLKDVDQDLVRTRIMEYWESLLLYHWV